MKALSHRRALAPHRRRPVSRSQAVRPSAARSKSARPSPATWLLVVSAATALVGCAGRSPSATVPSADTDDAAQQVATPVERIPVAEQTSWAEAVIYFVVLDRFADGDRSNNAGVDRSAKGAFHGGDLAGLTAQLNELSELGVTAIWLTPVNKNTPGFVTGAGFPDWAYHGYWADDFNAIDPRFGSEQSLKTLVEEAHARGMKVLLDVVYNHPGYDSSYERDPSTRTWLRVGDQCGEDSVTQCVAGLPDFKTERDDVATYLMDAQLGLAGRVGLDGFRLDTVKHIGMEFWEKHRDRVDAELGEDFHLLGEVWGGDAKVLDPWFETDTLDSGFDFGFAGSAIGFALGRGRPIAFNAYLERRRNPRDGYLLAHYLSSHDVPGALFQLEGDLEKFRLVAALQMTVSGMPTIYYGEEVGRLGGDWPENRSQMPWGDRDVLPGKGLARDESLRDWYRQLIAARRAHPALWRGTHKGLDFGQDHLVFLRQDPESESEVLVAANRGSEAVAVDLESPAGWSTSVDALTGETVEVEDGRLSFPVPPLGVRILSRSADSPAAGATP